MRGPRRTAFGAAVSAAALGAAVLVGPVSAQAPTALPLPLREAVKLALDRNLDLSIERLNPLIARQQSREAVGAFDPIVGAGVTYARTERFLNNLLERAAESGIVQENTFTSSYPSLIGRLPTGTQYNLSLVTSIVDSNNPLRLYANSYEPVLTFGVTQPLLRDFGWEVNTVKIRQAEKAEAIGTAGVEGRMLGVIRDVETRYWALFYNERHEAVAQTGLALALDLVERTTRARAAGLATDLDLVQARSAVQARRADLARAQADLAVAQSQLRLLVDPRVGVGAPFAVVGEPPDDGPPSDLAGKLARATAVRPEIRQQEIVIDKIALDERVAQNNAQWRLDALGSLGWNGLAGTGLNSNFPGTLPSRLQGQESYTDSFRGFLSPNGNTNYSVGLRLQIPIGNNEAAGRLGQVRLVRRQEELRLALLRNQIGVDVEAAFLDMTAQSSRLASAREALALAREQLEGQERELAAGLATVRRVLEAQDAYARAQDGLHQAWAEYAAARARLDASQAASLDAYGLVVQR